MKKKKKRDECTLAVSLIYINKLAKNLKLPHFERQKKKQTLHLSTPCRLRRLNLLFNLQSLSGLISVTFQTLRVFQNPFCHKFLIILHFLSFFQNIIRFSLSEWMASDKKYSMFSNGYYKFMILLNSLLEQLTYNIESDL